MKTNTIIGLLVVVLVVIGGFFYSQNKGEQSSEMQVSDMSAEALLIGTWQSLDDERSYVVYGSDGLMADIYDGEELGRGEWDVIDDEGKTLRVIQGPEAFEYSIIDLNEQELTMTYLGRGNILRYTRLNPSTDAQ